MKDDRVSEAVIHRLPKYYRYLTELDSLGTERVSSAKMSKDTGLNASQIRRDFNCFGGFGQQGYGYQVKRLRNEIKNILGINRQYNAIVIGAGNIGQALIKYENFPREGFFIRGVFDVDKKKIGEQINGLAVQPLGALKKFLRRTPCQIGIVATPKRAAQETADFLVSLGIRAIWNFAPTEVAVDEGISIENVNLSDSLYVLSYRMNTDKMG